MSSSLLYPSYNCKSTCNGFSNSFFVSNDDSTDNDSYSVEEEDAYPNNYLSTDLISSIDQMEPNDKQFIVFINQSRRSQLITSLSSSQKEKTKRKVTPQVH